MSEVIWLMVVYSNLMELMVLQFRTGRHYVAVMEWGTILESMMGVNGLWRPDGTGKILPI